MQAIGLLRQTRAGVVLGRARLFGYDVMLCGIRNDALAIRTLNGEGTVDSESRLTSVKPNAAGWHCLYACAKQFSAVFAVVVSATEPSGVV